MTRTEHDPRPLLAFGSFAPEERNELSQLAEQAAFHLHAADTLESANKFLEGNPTQALIVDSQEAQSLAVMTRSSARYAQLPMLALARELGD